MAMQPKWVSDAAATSSAPNAEKLVLAADTLMRHLWHGGDITTSTTPGCGLKPHAPIWGTKPDKETFNPIAGVQKGLWWGTMIVKLQRRDVEVAIHPDGSAICVFEKVSGALRCCPCCNIVDQALLFLVVVEDDGSGVLKACEAHELAAKTPADGIQLLKEKFAWPSESHFGPCSKVIGDR
jgi:hypothetical protein